VKIKIMTGNNPDRITNDRFVEIWNRAASLQDAADELGLEKTQAMNRAAFLRRKGVMLKSFSSRLRPTR
jgi:hypothetical protein